MITSQHLRELLYGASLAPLAIAQAGCLQPPCEPGREPTKKCFEVLQNEAGELPGSTAEPTGSGTPSGNASDSAADETTSRPMMTEHTTAGETTTGGNPCGNGAPDLDEECDPMSSPDGFCDDECHRTGKYAFVTSGAWHGNLCLETCDLLNVCADCFPPEEGFTGCILQCVAQCTMAMEADSGLGCADKICTDAANRTLDLGGEIRPFKAWLSVGVGNESKSAKGRLDNNVGPYFLPDGETLIAENLQQLLSSGPRNPIDQNEHAARLDPVLVWTNTTSEGVGADDTDCAAWLDDVTSAVVGKSSTFDQDWTENVVLKCSNLAHLYCFEQ